MEKTIAAAADDLRIAHWDARFAQADYIFGTAPNAFLASQAHLLRPGQRALAVADGEGRNGVWLARQGLQVTAVEASGNALAKARRLAAEHGVDIAFEQADLPHWTWPVAQYDVVAAIFIQFLTPAERRHVFAAMLAALKPGGLLLVQGYAPAQLGYGTGGPRVLEQLYTLDLLHELLGEEMYVLTLNEHHSEIDEGSGHRGMSALIDCVARKPAC